MNLQKKLAKLALQYRIDKGKKFRLKDYDPADTAGLADFKKQSDELVQEGVKQTAELQDKLFAQDRWAVLLIFQALDAAGKDSTIKHVMSGVNPQGCQVASFKVPSTEELDHDYLWRSNKHLPERGRIGIFNRSYYEEVLVVRVHPDLLKQQHLPEELVTKSIWNERFEQISNFEQYLTRNGTAIRKFFLHVSKEEQRKRFLERLEHPEKNWKFSPADVAERQHWDDYQDAYEDAIRHTSSEEAPWFVVPADHKWFTRLVVSSVIVDALKGLTLEYPEVDPATRRELEKAKALLLKEGPKIDSKKK